MTDFVMPTFDDEEKPASKEEEKQFVMPSFDEEVPSKVETPGMTKGLAQQAAQGLTFNFADELSGLLGGDTEKFRQESKAFKQEHPFLSAGANVTGALLPLLLPGVRNAAIRNPALTEGALAPFLKVGVPMGIGAIQGALSGAGEGETFDERLRNAGLQGTFGAIATPFAAKMAQGLGKMASGVGAFFAKGAADSAGTKLLAQAMKDEGLDPNVIAQQVAETTKRTGKPAMWIDFVDPDKYPKTYDLMGKGLLRAQTTDARMKLLARGEETVPRLVQDIKDRISKRGELAYEDLMKNRTTRSAEFGNAFDAVKSTDVGTPEVMDVLSRPFAKDAIRLAIRNAQDLGDKEAQDLFKRTLTVNPQTNEFEWVASPTLELIQKIKNLGYSPALKSVYEGKPITTDTGTILRQQRELLKAVDDAAPAYAGIRKKFADSADIDNARELGANLQRTLNQGEQGVGGGIKGIKSDDVVSEYKQMSKPEKDAFLQGLAATMTANVRRKAQSEGAQKVPAVVGNPDEMDSAMVQQLRDVLGNTQRFKTFMERLQAEKQIEKTTKEFAMRRGTPFDVDASAARDLVRMAGAGALQRPATAIPAFASRIAHTVTGQTPKIMTPIGQIATEQAGTTNPLIPMLLNTHGNINALNLTRPFTVGQIGQAIGPQFKKGGLAHL